MKEYSDLLLIEALLIDNDIENNFNSLKEDIKAIDKESIIGFINDQVEQNIYNQRHLNNLKKLINYLNLENKEELYKIIDNLEPSNDVYYYEYTSKYDVLKNIIEYKYSTLNVELLKSSIYYDYFAFESLKVDSNTYIEKYLPYILDNQLYLLFVNKLFSEYPDIFLDKKITKRIFSVLNYDINSTNDKEMLNYLKKLIKKVEYFSKHKDATIFDYDKFKYHKNLNLLHNILISNEDISVFHDYIMNGNFIDFLDIFIDICEEKNKNNAFLYNENMKNRFVKILNYIMDRKEDNYFKRKYNLMMYKWSKFKSNTSEGMFYYLEIESKYNIKELAKILKYEYHLIQVAKMSIIYEGLLYETYSLDENKFNQMISTLNIEEFVRWLEKMMFLDKSFFQNEFLKNRTLNILNASLIDDKKIKKQVIKMKKKIYNINKGLEY